MKKALAIALALCLCAAGICAFADVRTFWSPEAVERVAGWKPTGGASNGFMHLINSGAAALDATGVCKDKDGTPRMKKWTDVTGKDIDAMLKATKFSPANRGYFRGGGGMGGRQKDGILKKDTPRAAARGVSGRGRDKIFSRV